MPRGVGRAVGRLTRAEAGGTAPGSPIHGAEALIALASLVVNDRFLKGRTPGWISGKLSDLAGLYLFPLVLVAAAEVGCRLVGHPPPARPRAVGVAAVATAAVFAAIKLSAPAGDLFQVTFGWIRWPLSALESWLAGDGLTARARVVLVRDPTDLIALPMCALAWFVRGRPSPSRRFGDGRR